MKTLFLFLILAASSFGQPPLEPIRVWITTDKKDRRRHAIAKHFRVDVNGRNLRGV
jgi:hypothetical protein